MKRFFDPVFDSQVLTGEGSLTKWLQDGFHPLVTSRLAQLNGEPLTKVQFNQLLVLSQDASVSDGFFEYYWRQQGPHTYDVTAVAIFDKNWFADDKKTHSFAGSLGLGT